MRVQTNSINLLSIFGINLEDGKNEIDKSMNLFSLIDSIGRNPIVRKFSLSVDILKIQFYEFEYTTENNIESCELAFLLGQRDDCIASNIYQLPSSGEVVFYFTCNDVVLREISKVVPDSIVNLL